MQMETTFTGFANRTEGGRELAKALSRYRAQPDTVVLGLPRGGVVTAASIAQELALPLDVLIVRKLGTPGQEELAMGAIGPGGVRVLNDELLSALRIGPEEIERVTRHEQVELERRERLYRGGRAPFDLAGKTVIVVDDGLATGSTMEAAIAVIRHHNPHRIVLAIPVAPEDTCARLRPLVDELLCLESPEPFSAVGYWYIDFAQVEDEEVIRILRQYAPDAERERGPRT